ncbi:hypothetical protein ALC53_12764 [Atta colombica]|uniref:Uncharacterized protein n=1 Tax=Atta colombica TaxID=520822 RepID=A0A195AXW0_9HYME|nr:hypothetical protein ALC53_12764 [Atta colombica]
MLVHPHLQTPGPFRDLILCVTQLFGRRQRHAATGVKAGVIHKIRPSRMWDELCPLLRVRETKSVTTRRCVSPRTVIWKPSHIPVRQLIFIISQDSLNMQDNRDEGHYRAGIIRYIGMESGNGINSWKLKMPKGREQRKDEGRGDWREQCICEHQPRVGHERAGAERQSSSMSVVRIVSRLLYDPTRGHSNFSLAYTSHKRLYLNITFVYVHVFIVTRNTRK